MSDWRADPARRRVQEIRDDLSELEALVRGSDSALVYTKLNTIDTALRLLDAYLAEAEAVPENDE